MSWSNIYLQLITATGPVIGEGLLDGWEGSIELRKFDWEMNANKKATQGGLKLNASTLKSIVGLGPDTGLDLKSLSFTKRLDVASSQIHTCLDNGLPVISASITVLHFSPSALPKGAAGDVLSVASPAAGALEGLHKPGFILLATNGRFESAKLSLEDDGRMKEMVETVTMSFETISISYVKPIGPAAVPMPPFIYTKKPEKK